MKIKKITASIMALTAVISTFPSVSATLANDTTSLYFTATSYTDYTLKHDVQIDSDSVIPGGKAWEISVASDGTPCYIAEPGKSVATNIMKYQDGLKYSEYRNRSLSRIGDTELTEEQMTGLNSVLLYGFSGEPNDAVYGYDMTVQENDADFAPKYIATQLLIWEVMAGQRNNYYDYCDDWTHWKRDFSYQSNGYSAVSEILDSFTDSSKGEQVRKYYEEYEQAIKAESKRITFAADKSYASGKNDEFIYAKNDSFRSEGEDKSIYEFRDNSAGNISRNENTASISNTDFNNVLNEFDVTVTNGKLLDHSDNKLTVKADDDSVAEIKFTHKASDKCMPVFFDVDTENAAALIYPEEMHREYYAFADGVKNYKLKAETLFGDVDTDGKIGVSDTVCIAKFNANQNKFPLSEQGFLNADVTHDGIVDASDLLKLVEFSIQKIDSLD